MQPLTSPPEFALEKARNCLHAITYRRTGHTSFDPATYRPEGEAAREEAANDPITRQRDVLAKMGLSAEDLGEIHARSAGRNGAGFGRCCRDPRSRMMTRHFRMFRISAAQPWRHTDGGNELCRSQSRGGARDDAG